MALQSQSCPRTPPRYIGREVFAPEHRITVRGEAAGLDLDLRSEMRVRESNHRIKNSLQLVSSMLTMQARASRDASVASALLEAAQRVAGIARLHERLQASGDYPVQAGALVAETCAEFAAVTGCEARGVRIEVQVDPVSLSLDAATTLGLIVNELASNCLKHAYPERGGTIYVQLAAGPDRRLVVADEGPGLQPGAAAGLGLTLVRLLARKIGGALTIDSAEPGTRAVLRF
jgi:two-component sensor histidine kinase